MKMNKRRTRKEQRQDSQEHYGGLAGRTPDKRAADRFNRPAYQTQRAVRAQGEQIHKSVDEYVKEKYGEGRI
jgi:hypothetical protein